ncbi:Transcription termination protein NusA [Christensenella hongkongensis]|uniref:Transcription termination protein NusA n=3 Tax=Christensenella hongkongensis TaxID=270498 RepID=A0A0M2NML1_9FIRM|nr:Transcription termination protein NusA [Christensenella hongkongensis]
MVQINEDEKAAKVIVPDYQLSLAIGKEGQNARLAAKLTGWKIDIKSQSQIEEQVFGEKFANADTSLDSMENEFDVIDELNEEEAQEEIEEDILLDEMEETGAPSEDTPAEETTEQG